MGAGVIAADRLLRTVRAGVPRQTKNRKIWTEGRSKRQAQPCVFIIRLLPMPCSCMRTQWG